MAQAFPATTQVFSTTELLESILLHTLAPTPTCGGSDERTLLLAQRVSTNFRSCILGSPEIQRRLGFRAVTDESTWSESSKVNDFLFERHDPVSFSESTFPTSHRHEDMPEAVRLRVDPHAELPYIEKVSLPGLGGFMYHSDLDSVDAPSVLTFERIDLYRIRRVFETNSPSWIDMYPHQSVDERIVLEVTGRFRVIQRSNMTVKLQTLKVLIELATSLQNTVDYFEQIESGWRGRNGEKFDWRQFFTEEQMEMMICEPEYSGDWDYEYDLITKGGLRWH